MQAFSRFALLGATMFAGMLSLISTQALAIGDGKPPPPRHADAPEPCPPAVKPVSNAKQALELAEHVIKSYQLTSLRRECLHLLLSEPGKNQPAYRIDVRENHNDRCGGDPAVSPRVVSIEISSNGQIKADNNDQLEMRTPVCATKRK